MTVHHSVSLPPFGYAHPHRIVRFGCGVLSEIGDILDQLDRSRALVLCTPSGRQPAEQIREVLRSRVVAMSDDVRARVPIDAVDTACRTAESADADVLVALGGGSAIGLAKGVAARTALPVVAVPTTYSGSEMTSIYGVSEGGRKQGGFNPVVAPRAILYDPELTYALPAALTASTGMNALAQAIGSLSTRDSSPVSALFAAEGIRRLIAALPRCVNDSQDTDARTEALLGSHFCGWALSLAGLSAHHDLAHALGDLTQLPHASVHAALLPQTTYWASRRHPGAGATLRTALATDDPAGRVYDLLGELGIPPGLSQLDLTWDAFAAARETLYRELPERWRDEDRAELGDLLVRTHRGTRPPTTAPERNEE
ncbi:maleylacetate reductase [Amycolatopsis ultiminotia]|uniref:Maleylacetate reductase n=1 Tax=Amycolatopsis ultiminotia TaxID=543629 RepID=A0ABP6W174_9PSEU